MKKNILCLLGFLCLFSTPLTAQTLVYQESFRQIEPQWSGHDDMYTHEKLEDGKFFITQKQAKYSYHAVEVALDDGRDYSVETMVTHISGTEQSPYGLVFASDGVDNYYVFGISAKGDYFLGYRSEGHYKSFIGPVESAAIKRGNNVSNKLRVETAGDKLKLIINDHPVNVVNMIQPYGNDVGFVVEKEQTAAFSYLKVLYLSDPDKDVTSPPVKTIAGLPKDTVKPAVTQPPKEIVSVPVKDTVRRSINPTVNTVISQPVKDSVKHTTVATVSVAVKDTSKRPVAPPPGISVVNQPVNPPVNAVINPTVRDTAKHTLNSLLKDTVKQPVKAVAVVKDTVKQPISLLANNSVKDSTRHPLQPLLKDTAKLTAVIPAIKDTAKHLINVQANNLVSQPVKDTIRHSLNTLLKDTVKQPVNQPVNAAVTKPVKDTVKQQVNKPLAESIVEMAYHTDFSTSDPTGWGLNQTDSVSTVISTGELRISRKLNSWFTDALRSPAANIDMHRNFLVETAATHYSGGNNYGYGIEFGADSSRQYHFWITATGSYNICYTSGNGFRTPIKYGESTAIKKGDSVKNELAIEQKDNQLYFFINNRQVEKLPEIAFSGQLFGLSVHLYQSVGFDHLTFGYLDQPPLQVKTVTLPGPEIKIISPEVTRGLRIFKGDTLHVAGTAKDRTGIFSVKVNDIEASVGINGDFIADIPMAPGDNTLKVTALSMDRRASEFTFHIVHSGASPVNDQTAGATIDSVGKYYALLIGEEKYQDSRIPGLDGPISDANKLKDALIKNYTFQRENVTVLPNPTREELFNALIDIKNKVAGDDNVLIFFAGHGYYDDVALQGYWLPSDAEKDKSYTWISNSDILTNITSIRSKHTLLISDACFSGSIFKARSIDLAPKAIRELYKLPSRKAITSGTLKEEVADNSAFLQYLVKNLNENSDLYLSAEQLFERFKAAVINNSEILQVPQFGELRGAGDEGGDFIFIRKN